MIEAVEDDDEGRLIQPVNFGAIQRSLIYEFRSRNGILYVNAIYNKNFIIDKFHFSVSRLFQEKKMRGMQFTVPGSITEFNLGPFCILIEDILIQVCFYRSMQNSVTIYIRVLLLRFNKKIF